MNPSARILKGKLHHSNLGKRMIANPRFIGSFLWRTRTRAPETNTVPYKVSTHLELFRSAFAAGHIYCDGNLRPLCHPFCVCVSVCVFVYGWVLHNINEPVVRLTFMCSRHTFMKSLHTDDHQILNCNQRPSVRKSSARKRSPMCVVR